MAYIRKNCFLTLFMLMVFMGGFPCISYATDQNNTIDVRVGDLGITKMLIVELEKNNIWYNRKGQTIVSVKNVDSKNVLAILNSFKDPKLPK